MPDPTVLEVYRREVTPELYHEVRELYKRHSMAEDARDLDGLISTLTPDCVYELVQTGHRWEGHDGARRFYTGLLTAFPDIRFDLTDIVIGPQGVCEEADVTATQSAPGSTRRPNPGGSSGRCSSGSPGTPTSTSSVARRSTSAASNCRPRSVS